MTQPYLVPPMLRGSYDSNGQDVFDFHVKFLVPMAPRPALLDADSQEFRVKFMQEELNEFVEACNDRNLLKAADALVDLVYVALGTALMMGVPWTKLWNRVQRKNMLKERAADDGSNSARGSPLDVIKPRDWTPPDHTPDLGPGPWPTFDASAVAAMIAAHLKEQANQTGLRNFGPGRNNNVVETALDKVGQLQQGRVLETSVETRPDGSKHYTSVAGPADFKTKGGNT
jgi:predicted HAD superfamily Cof-like phosphohydrolase